MELLSDKSTNEREGGLRIGALVCGIDVILIGFAAIASNSLAILSDFLKEITDFSSMIAAFITLRVASRPPSERFSYGIGKLENLVSLLIAGAMTISAISVIFHALKHFKNPEPLTGALPGILIFSGYAVVGFFIYFRNKRILNKIYSPIISAQANLWISKAIYDVIMAVSLSIAMNFDHFTWALYIDPVASLVGAGILFYSAAAILSHSVGDLLDATLEETLQIQILKELVQYFDDYEHLYRIKARRSGSRIFVEITLSFEPQLLMREVQTRIHKIQGSIKKALPGAEVSINLANIDVSE